MTDTNATPLTASERIERIRSANPDLFDRWQAKANYSQAVEDPEEEGLEVYRGFAINPDDPDGFTTRQEVDGFFAYLSSASPRA